MTKKKRAWLIGIGIFLLLLGIFWYMIKIPRHYPKNINLEHRPNSFGATFSKKFATEIDLDWQEAYQAIINDLGVRKLRLPSYWDEINPDEGVYNFTDLDTMVQLASEKGVEIIIVVGHRQPRWPECHAPSWIMSKEQDQKQKFLLEAIETTVNRYKDNPQVVAWQVENEPFLGTFGVCPPLDREFLDKEVALVKSLTDRPVIVTASGEMSSWKEEVKLGDIFGSTLYRVVYDHRWGFFRHFFGPSFYQLKAKLAGIDYKDAMIIELQTEPWVPDGKMIYLSKEDIDISMSVDQLKANLQFAIDTEFKEVYVWGVEWWYWQKLYGSPEYWKIGQFMFDAVDSLTD